MKNMIKSYWCEDKWHLWMGKIILECPYERACPELDIKVWSCGARVYLVLLSHRVRIVVSYDVLCPLGEDRGRVLPLVLRLDVGLVIAEVHAHEVASALGHRVCLVVGVIVARSQQETCIQSMKKKISNRNNIYAQIWWGNSYNLHKYFSMRVHRFIFSRERECFW